MVGLNSWLFPRTRASSGDDAAFWPETCFTIVPNTPWSDELLASMDSGAAAMPADFLAYSAVVGHEQTHWIQAHAFGYGRFLARIDQARSEIAESFLGLFTSEQVAFLSRRRLQGEPMLRLANSHRVARRPELGLIGQRLQRHWWSLGLLRHEFETSDRKLASLEPTALRYGLASLYARAGPNVSLVALLPPAVLNEMVRELAPDESYARELGRSGHPTLSSLAIAECSAVLNQHWTYSHATELLQSSRDTDGARQLRSIHSRSQRSQEATVYSEATRVFARLCPQLDLSQPRVLHTLAVICTLAMDGNYFPEVVGHRPTWLDISPPLRFQRLAKAVLRVGLVGVDTLAELPASKTRAYLADLLDAAGLPQRRRRRLPAAAMHTSAPSPVASLRQLMHDAHLASIELAKRLPAALIAPGETVVRFAHELEEGQLKHLRLARLPPLLSVGGRGVAVGISERRFAECTVAGAYQRLLLQLMADTNALNFEGLPRDGLGLAAARRALAVLQERTERPVSMRIDARQARIK